MTEKINHECGIAFVRLLKPLEYYQYNYGTWKYGLQKLYLLMQKQHNRGQDGVGVANIKHNIKPGKQYIFRQRAFGDSALPNVFKEIYNNFNSHDPKKQVLMDDPFWAKENVPFAGETFLGHLRYGTFGTNVIDNVHPVLRENNWQSRTLVLAGNFNLTNVDEIFSMLVELGQHPKDYSDTVTILENMGHFLETETQKDFVKFKKLGFSNLEISQKIADNLNIGNILRDSSKKWDGGYVISGVIGYGDAFVIRDPWGIRPAYYFHNDEVAVVTSERPVIQTAFNVPFESVKELPPGHAFIVKHHGEIKIEKVREEQERRACSFERIYFSRGSDKDIYLERKKLGELLVPSILKAVDNDIPNTVFSYIPNTAESAFYGMMKHLEHINAEEIKKKIFSKNGSITEQELGKLMSQRPRVEKVAIKDVKLRTFITQDDGRDALVAHVYDTTYGTIRPGEDNLVVIDDSIVRGTTLKKSIIKILDRLHPKRIVIVSSSPQIRYPDCYGIDMAKLADFIAFKAAIQLLKENNKENIINEVYKKSKAQENFPKEKMKNHVKEIYAPFTAEQISVKIAEMLKTDDVKSELKIVYQSIENLHEACPDNLGDWYFTGNYPTPGGNKVVSRSFINYIEDRNERAY